MKQCQFCEKSMKHSNFSRHNQKCYVRINFGVSKNIIINLINGKFNSQESEESILHLKISKLEKFTEKFLVEARELVAELKNFDPDSRLSEMTVGASTLVAYKSEWKQYSCWCRKSKLDPLVATTANSYIAQLNKKTTTLKKKRSILQVVLQFLTDRPVVLRKIRRRISVVPKYSMSQSEVTDYLKEQSKISEETYLIQLLLITYGCRIHSVACLTVGDIDFLRKKIFFPDSKTGTREATLADDMSKKLKNFINKKQNQSSSTFVFTAKSENPAKRAAEICKKVNYLIRESSVLRSNQNYKFSSHMFRKTVAFTLYQQLIVDAKKYVRKSIGQAEGSSAIEYYIH